MLEVHALAFTRAAKQPGSQAAKRPRGQAAKRPSSQAAKLSNQADVHRVVGQSTPAANL